jgi:hypothetical protein
MILRQSPGHLLPKVPVLARTSQTNCPNVVVALHGALSSWPHEFSTPPKVTAQQNELRGSLVVVGNFLDQLNDGPPQTIMINSRECL